MTEKTKSINLDHQGVDAAAAAIETWLTEAKVQRKDILRIRLTMEELLGKLCTDAVPLLPAELRFRKGPVFGWLRVRYGGERCDPMRKEQSEIEELSNTILSRTGHLPEWRWRVGKNELRLRVRTGKLRSEFAMLGCILLAVAVGLLGVVLPAGLKTGAVDYCLSFLSGGFMNLLSTFIGLMVFLSVVTGICGIGSAAAFGRIGKLMLSRFVGISFLLGAFMTVAIRFIFPLNGGTLGGGNQVLSILQMLFGILPTNPIKPFLEGNTLQIVFMGIDASFSRTVVPIGCMLFAGVQTLYYMISAAYLAEYYGVPADAAWWIVFWIVCVLVTLATPPVAGGGIACLSIGIQKSV